MPKNLGLYNDDLSTPRKKDVDTCYGPNNAPPYPVTSVNGQTGSVNLTASDVGAAPSSHSHTKNQITDFPTSMTPTAHASTHASGGSDQITPASIGAAKAGFGYGEACASIIYNDDSDGTKLNTKLDELLSSMPNRSTMQFHVSDYPYFSGTTYNAILFKHASGAYASLFLFGYGGIAHKRKSNGTWGGFETVYSSFQKPSLSDLGVTYGTSDLTAGSSALATGKLYFVYE